MVSAMFLASCADDVYDPSKEPQTPPAENPFGEGFAAPDGFNWSMINSVKLNVEVKDEFNGQYQYLIEVFTGNPLTDKTLTPIAAGAAKQGQNYVAEINIPKALTILYIRQTDPKQRKEIYEFAVPENGGALNCKLYYTGTTTRAMTRASQDGGTSGWDNITDPGYTEQTYTLPPTSATINSSDQLQAGDVYVIRKNETLNKAISAAQPAEGKATVYVEGTWTIADDWKSIHGIDIIVLEGGKLISTGNRLTLENRTSITVQSGGEVECNALHGGDNTLIVNFGTITSEDYSFNPGSVFYNKKDVIIRGVASATNTWEKNFYLDSAILHNHGTITGEKARMGSNDNMEAQLLNYDLATIKLNEFIGGATIVNSGFIELNVCNNSSTDALYNNCTFIIKKEFKFRNVVLDKGSITGGRTNPSDTEWLPVPYVESQTDAKFTLIDGSMIKATNFKVLSGGVVFKATNTTGNSSKSMIKAENGLEISEPTNVELLGNLVIEGEIKGLSQYNQLKANESVNTGYDESQYTIETCGGIFNEGNEGEDPYTPEIPVIDDATTYTYVFEDNWPKYGDFDLNDIVLTISNRSVQANASGNLKSAKLDIALKAVGASKVLGVGIRFFGLPENITPKKFTVKGVDASFEAGQSLPTLILFENAHGEFSFSDERPFINTTQDASTNSADVPDYSIRFEFEESSNVPASAFNINNLDVFVITRAADQKNKRLEVHVAGYAPTDLANTKLFGQGNDKSSADEKRYYLSSENLAWGVVIPTDFAWPLEYKNIKDVYTNFFGWVTSGGKENKDWYNSHNGQVFKK